MGGLGDSYHWQRQSWWQQLWEGDHGFGNWTRSLLESSAPAPSDAWFYGFIRSHVAGALSMVRGQSQLART